MGTGWIILLLFYGIYILIGMCAYWDLEVSSEMKERICRGPQRLKRNIGIRYYEFIDYLNRKTNRYETV